MRFHIGAAALVLSLLVSSAASARPQKNEAPATAQPLEQKSGKYAVTLRLPPGGVFADEEAQIEFRLVDASAEDPVLGAPGVIRAKIEATITMPAMASMPSYRETAHAESVPGEYGVHPSFPHGGAYLLTLDIAPPGDQPFTVSFPFRVGDADPLRPPAPKPFFVEVSAKPDAPRAGEEADIHFVIRDRTNPKAIVRDFDIAHTKIFHLLIVRDDLGEFAHEHPEQLPDGSFHLRFAFPTEGTYHLFADVAPRARGSQVLMGTLEVKPAKSAPKPAPFVVGQADTGLTKVVDGIKVTLTPQPGFVTRQQTIWSFELVDASTGKPITDLEPYLGAMGHMILVHEDGTTFVHCHPDETASTAGGQVPFIVRLPKPGRYRAWAQFQRGGRVSTFDFVVSAGG